MKLGIPKITTIIKIGTCNNRSLHKGLPNNDHAGHVQARDQVQVAVDTLSRRSESNICKIIQLRKLSKAKQLVKASNRRHPMRLL